MSKHNQYPAFADKVIQRWKKIPIYVVTGWRVNPYKPDTTITFVLRSREENFDFSSGKLSFCYETDVLELYSEEECVLFKNANKILIAAGFLVPMDEVPVSVDMVNALSDSDVQKIASISRLAEFKTEVQKITSKPTLQRILESLPDDKAQGFYKAVVNRMKEL